MLLLFVILVTILLVQGTRRIPVQYAKRVVGNKQYGGVRQFIPLKVNAAGVMPIIFAQAIMFVPLYLTQRSRPFHLEQHLLLGQLERKLHPLVNIHSIVL